MDLESAIDAMAGILAASCMAHLRARDVDTGRPEVLAFASQCCAGYILRTMVAFDRLKEGQQITGQALLATAAYEPSQDMAEEVCMLLKQYHDDLGQLETERNGD